MFLNCIVLFYLIVCNILLLVLYCCLEIRGKFLCFYKSILDNIFLLNFIVLFNNFYLDLYMIEYCDIVMFESICLNFYLYLVMICLVLYFLVFFYIFCM